MEALSTGNSPSLGSKIRELRKGQLGTQTVASQLLGISKNTLSAYERDESLPDVDFLAQLAALSGGNLYELIELRLMASHLDIEGTIRELDPMRQLQRETRAAARHAREAIKSAGEALDNYWQLAIMELAAREEITPTGVEHLINLIQEWEPDADLLQKYLDALSEGIQDHTGDDDD